MAPSSFIALSSVRMGKKKNRNAQSPNAEGVTRGAVGAEDRAQKAR